MRLTDLARGRTLVCGFGREGRALERAVLARSPDAAVEVWCDRDPDAAPRRWPLHVGVTPPADVEPDRVLRSPGVPVDQPALSGWRARGVPVTCISSLWFGERPDARVIAVTGSKGKSTTASLITHMLRHAGLRIELAGNIGVPMLEHLESRPDWFVVELSSYQLADLQGALDVGVITRLFPEHQDWHGGVQAYYDAKLRIIDLLGDGPLWINARDPVLMEHSARAARCRLGNRPEGLHARPDGLYDGERRLRPAASLPLIGEHNCANLALALALVESLRVERDKALASLDSFHPLPHRLQWLTGPDGSVWINDSISTTPYATLAALQASPVAPVLLAGGLERGGDWTNVIDHLRASGLAGLVALPDNGARIADEFEAAGTVDPSRIVRVQDLPAGIAAARRLCPPNGCVLLSPGAPSFPRFRDFEQRGEVFIDAVERLGREKP